MNKSVMGMTNLFGQRKEEKMIKELIEIIQPENQNLIELRIVCNKNTPDAIIHKITEIGEKLEIAYLKGWAACEKHYGITIIDEIVKEGR
jgi:hypothetical protein